MKTSFKKLKTLLLILVAMLTISVTFIGCKDDDDPAPGPDMDIVELAQATPSLSTLVTAIEAAGLTSTLKGPGPYTVFAPTNTAFDNLPDGALDALLANPAVLAEVLTYHVVSGKVMSSDLMTGSVSTLLSGETIDVNVSGGAVTLNGSASVTSADNEATNGVVHIIDEVLLPEDFEVPKQSIVAIAAATPELSTLVEALSLFPDLVTALSSEGTYTVFAPDNDAFAALLTAIGQTSLDDVPESVIRTILEYHVIATAAIMSGDLSDGQTADAFSGEEISVSINNDGIFISGAKVGTPDIGASNGIIHMMEDVMVPPSIAPIVGTIVAPAYFNMDFTTLIEAVLAADEDILSVLLSDGPSDQGLTLFAPTNDAFVAAGITTLPDGATLSAVLKYHVIDGTVEAGDLPTTTVGAAEIPTLGGDFYLTNKGGDAGVFINGNSQVVVTDIDGSNGVVHVIDRTLLPASNNIVEIAQSFDPDEFTQLVAALARTSGENPDLLAALSGAGDFTVFAPTDAAFEALLTDLGLASVNDIPLATLTAVLQHHVIATPRVFSADLESGSVGTLNGDITIDASAGTITDGSDGVANLTSTLDVLATNGVIHVIDKVLVPAP
ncbi:MAG: fasciclin domain-containing protein [Cyclobacteriaceae bacterium]|nr:fasciclin domain-containing protein [Cyclobacteriaceae bacterium]